MKTFNARISGDEERNPAKVAVPYYKEFTHSILGPCVVHREIRRTATGATLDKRWQASHVETGYRFGPYYTYAGNVQEGVEYFLAQKLEEEIREALRKARAECAASGEVPLVELELAESAPRRRTRPQP